MYKKGTDNRAADALSRRHHDPKLYAISIIQPKWLEEVIASYQLDSSATEMLSALAINPNVVPNFTLKDGLLRYKSRIWIGQNKPLHLKIIAAMHDLALGGRL